jgi:hypothetical protein
LKRFVRNGSNLAVNILWGPAIRKRHQSVEF